MKSVTILLVIAALSSVHASPKQKKKRATDRSTESSQAASSAISVTLQDGKQGRIENGRVLLAQKGGTYAAAAPGRYTTRDGKVLLVGNDGRLTNSTTLKAEPPPQPEAKRKTAPSNGQYHQTGSHL